MTTIAMVKCEAGCGRSLRPGSTRYCSRCEREAAELAAQLEEKWQRDRLRNRSYGVAADRERIDSESLSAPAARDAERRSALMTTLPRVDVGMDPWPRTKPSAGQRGKTGINVSSVLIGLALATACVWLACGR